MNSRVSKELKRLAEAAHPEGTTAVYRTGFIAVTARSKKLKRAGMPFYIFYNTGRRPLYQRLKKAYMAIPRPYRNIWLKAQWSLVG